MMLIRKEPRTKQYKSMLMFKHCVHWHHAKQPWEVDLLVGGETKLRNSGHVGVGVGVGVGRVGWRGD